MSKTKHNRSFGKIVTVAMIFATAFTMIIGCNTERRAERLIDKGDRIDGRVMPRKCAERFPSINSKDSIYIYKQGEPIVIQDTVTLFDTINNTTTKYITKYVNTTDTAFRYIRITEVNKARETALENTIKNLRYELTKSQTEGNIWMWLAIAFGSYSIVRWLLRIIWNIKLP